MSRHVRPVGIVLAIGLAVVLAATGMFQGPLRAQVAPPQSANEKGLAPGGFDVRSSGSLRAQALQQRQRTTPAAALAARRSESLDALAQLRKELPGAEVTFSTLTGGVDVVRNPGGALTPPSGAGNGYALRSISFNCMPRSTVSRPRMSRRCGSAAKA